MFKWMRETILMYKGLPKEIYVLFIARVINRLGGFVSIILTFFLTVNLGLTSDKAGLISSVAGVTSLMGTLIGGKLGDSIGRKKVYIIAQSTAAVLFIPCGFLGNSMAIPILLIISAFFSAIVQPINTALVIDLVDKEDRKRAFSLLYFGINLGVAIGPIIAGYLFYHYIRWIFWGDAITTFIAIILVAVYIKETKLSDDEINEINDSLDEEEKLETGNTIITFLKRPVLVAFTVLGILTSFVYAQSGFALPITLTELFHEKGSIYFGNIMSFNALIVVVFTVIVTKLTDKYRPVFNVAGSNLLYGIGFGMMAFVHSVPMIFISVFLWTIGEILGVTNTGVFVANHTPISHRSRFSAIIGFLRSLGNMLSPFIGGLLIVHFSMRNLWILTGLFALFAFFGMVFIGVAERKKERFV